tara:strand:- start:752 stop:3097 length:2346 start_codon:yes stop_codon:yes gene_type:complete
LTIEIHGPADLKFGTIVPPNGKLDAPIIILGEAPGQKEEIAGIPFIGPSGNLLFDDILGRAKIKRDECLVMDVYWRKPPANKWDKIKDSTEFHENVRELICRYPRKLIIAVGKEALSYLLDDNEISINSYRGSILYDTVWPAPIISMIHPKDVFRHYPHLALCRLDAKRAKMVLDKPEVRDYERTIIQFAEEKRRLGGEDEVFHYYMGILDVYKHSACIAFDIETYKETITCIGMSRAIDHAIVIPLTGQFRRANERKLLQKLKQCLESDALKIGQNLDYDVQYLARLGIGVRNVWMDTMVAHSCVQPELRHDLATLTSIYTLHPYYKEMRKEATSGNYNETMWIYNGTDCCITLEVALRLAEDLKKSKSWDLFHEISMPVQKTLIRMETQGILIDKEKRDKRLATISTEIEELESLPILEGVNPKSPKQVKDYLKEHLPPAKAKAVRSADVSVLKRVRNTNVKLQPFIDKVLEVRGLSKIVGTYLKAETGKNSRMHTSYRTSSTDTGRISSSKDVFNRGMNLQNVPLNQRDWFIPDPGLVFWDCDASQIEARITAWMAQDEFYIKAFIEERDQHSENASRLFGVPLNQVNETPAGSPYSYRDIGKRATHAMNYMVGSKKLKNLINEYVPKMRFRQIDAERFIAVFMQLRPGVVRWWMKIQTHLKSNTTLRNPYGRPRTFLDRFDNELIRKAVAFLPQSTAADHINKALHKIESRLNSIPKSNVLLQVHDSIGGQCRPEDLEIVEAIVIEEMEKSLPLAWNNETLKVPAEFKSGATWKDCK